ncbi:DNA-methyltransferase [Mycobacterium avium]|uniref:DNA-methyltransferase n=1 Tax=Mycobacterium avium TaxID=1764 RepID=UPI000A05248C|nr:DNA methyltransferase [Mycobacterium avium]
MRTPYFVDDTVTLYEGDCLDVLPAALKDASVDAVVCDPPYGLEFMGRGWDSPWERGDDICVDAAFTAVGMKDGRRLPRPTYTGTTNPKCINCGGTRRGRRDGAAIVKVCTCAEPAFPNVRGTEMQAFQEWCRRWAAECMRVLKPGGHLLAFGHPRTWHRLAAAIEDTGFELRDSIAWLYGSGFPKSLDVAKAIDSGSRRPEDIRRMRMGDTYVPSGRGRVNYDPGAGSVMNGDSDHLWTPSSTATKWQGWGTALKPAFEPIVVARKPLAGNVAANVLAHGVGALNIDGCRIHTAGSEAREYTVKRLAPGATINKTGEWKQDDAEYRGTTTAGRWPTNVVLDESQAAELDAQTGVLKSGANPTRRRSDKFRNTYGAFAGQSECVAHRDADAGGASRFFPVFRYNAKASDAERPTVNGVTHPTVKPLDLMRWLVRLVTPPHGVVLDPFGGSGTTAEAAIYEHKRAIVIERDPDYLSLTMARLSKPMEVGFDFEEPAS